MKEKEVYCFTWIVLRSRIFVVVNRSHNALQYISFLFKIQITSEIIWLLFSYTCSKMFRTKLDKQLKSQRKDGSAFFDLRESISVIIQEHLKQPTVSIAIFYNLCNITQALDIEENYAQIRILNEPCVCTTLYRWTPYLV